MNCKKSLSAFLSVLMVVTMVASVIVMPVAATEENGNVSFRSPAITANVGETIDLTKYGVEFTEGTTTKDGLTWWKSGKSDTVPFTAPAILANVGETVNLTDWNVEFTKGTATDKANISWTKKLDPNTVTFGMPAILVNAGDVIDLTAYAVEFENGVATNPTAITWKNGDAAVTSFTPAAKGVTALTATAGDVTKTVYVVAKAEADTEYVLYENDFNEETDLNDVVHLTGDKSYPGAGTDSIIDGQWRFVRAEGNTTSNRLYMLPEWLCAFGDYTLEMNATVNAQGSTSRYLGFLFRGQTGTDSRPYAIVGFQRNKSINWGHRVSTETKWNPVWYTAKTNAYTIPALGTAATYKMSVNADVVKVYYNGMEVAATNLPDEAPDMGRPGIMTAGLDFDIDYYKITLTEPVKEEEVTAFTPQATGVTAFAATVNGVSKTVYVVAKEAEDTEYVLYQNDFDTAASVNDLTKAGYGGGNTSYGYNSTTGMLDVLRTDTGNRNLFLFLPEYIGDFGDYIIEMNYTNLSKYNNNTRYTPVVFRASGSSLAPYYTAWINFDGKAAFQKRTSTSWAFTELASVASSGVSVAVGTNVTYVADVKGDTVKFSANGTEVLTYDGLTDISVGRVGFGIVGTSAEFDYIKVTLHEPETADEQLTAFTPDKAGVTALTVKDAEGNEKTVYVVAKEEADTEYVLYENDFDNAFDANALTVAEGAATLSVENGKLTVATSGAYVYLPAFLGDFGDYKMQMVASTTAYGASSDWLAFLARGQHTDSANEVYVARVRHASSAWDAAGYYYRDADGTMHRHEWGGHATISTGSTHTYTLLAQGDLISLKQDDNYVFYATEPKEQHIGQIGFATSNVTLSVDSIRVTLSDIEKPAAPVSASFIADAGLPYGTISGALSVDLDAVGDAAVDVVYYWGDGEGKLAGYGAFDKVLVNGKATVTDTIPVGTVVPAGATELRVYTANEAGESDNCVVVPLPLSVRNMTFGEEKLSFQMASDSHTMSGSSVNQETNDEHFIDLLQDIAKFDPDSAGLFHGGDIVDNGKIAEYERFKEIWDTYSNGLALEGIIGNHEYWDTKTHADTVNNFANYTGIAITPETPYYTKNVGGYDFFFLNSSIIDPSGGNHNIATLGDTQLAWLDAGLAAVDADTPAFIFHHQKFNQIADADALKAILAKYPNAIFMTSHTHTDMNTANVFEYENDAMCKTANTSAVSYTVYTHYNPHGENVQARSQAYYVEVYEDRVLFRGMDIMTDEWLPSAQFVFWYGDVDTYPLDANLFPAAGADYEDFAFDASALTAVGDDGFTAEDTATVAELEGKFNFYYDREGAHYRERNLFENPDDNDNYNPAGTATGWSKWVPSGEWLQRTTGKTSGEMFRKIDSLVPLNSAGEEVVAENFETTFDVKFVNFNGGVILGFRQQNAGHFTAGYYNIVKTMGFVAINKGGMSIASGNDILNTSGGDATNDMYNHFETDFDTDLPETVTVKVKVIGNDIAVDIYDYTTKELLHSEQDTLSYAGAGKIAYGISAVGHSIGNIELTKLNRFGEPLDLATNRDYENGALNVVDMQETDAGYKYTFALTPDAGYELKAGSLYVVDVNGNYYVPERVGFREGGDASLYTVTVKGEGSVCASFIAPTADKPNIGNLGTSVNDELAGVRFISRFTRVVENDTEYVVLGGEKYAVSDYGMLMGLEQTVGDNELNLALTETNKYVLKLSVKERGIYYDLCDDHIDMSVCITGVDNVAGGADMRISSRAYVALENGTVLYGTVNTGSYNENVMS